MITTILMRLGPIRSGRDQFFQLILPWQALYIHEGQSVVMQQYALDYDYGLLNNNDGASGYRDYNRVKLARPELWQRPGTGTHDVHQRRKH